MAIVEITEMLGARSGSIDQQWRRSYRRAWRVLTDSATTGAFAVRTAIPVALGNSYVQTDAAGGVLEHDTFAFATKIEAQVDSSAEDDRQWIVTVDYGPYDAMQFPENPLNHPLKISWGANRFERAADEDVDGNAILNSAGDYFDPPITADDSRPTLKVVRNEAYYNPQYADLWKDTVNKDTFFGFSAKSVKCLGIPAELEYHPVCGFYYVVSYEFEINSDGWERKILDQGLRLLDAATGKQKPAVDENGQPVSSPVLLDGSGGQLTPGDDPAYLTFKVYKESDFAAFGLDPSGAPGQMP